MVMTIEFAFVCLLKMHLCTHPPKITLHSHAPFMAPSCCQFSFHRIATLFKNSLWFKVLPRCLIL